MLLVWQYFVTFQAVHDEAVQNVFHDFAAHRSQRDWPVIAWVGKIAFLEDRGNVCLLPIRGYGTLTE